ncbi:GATA zinc finger domain-containing protein 16 isoform X2 [Topomyia yanbarensis]|uniref:GATA zinc finger domain-containing protein 16 isoform X2 n=1 Tax=Topomyia yanbarensis TaxID=2498891 RepID=UPI00273CED4A|nr:GATA zinc finger domain-containing protein 16 isoform X2 [Topomyia yanbarensis]
MARLTEEMVIARSKQSDLAAIKKLNCWGSELSDVSIIRRMRGVEVLAFSVNRISTLSDFENCLNLQELYLRKNNITDIDELIYLQNLPKLKYLWLEENPLVDSAGPNYRQIVLRALPNLKKLDNVDVTPEEVTDAMRAPVAQHQPRHDAYEDSPPPSTHQHQHQQHRNQSPVVEQPQTTTPSSSAPMLPPQQISPENTESECISDPADRGSLPSSPLQRSPGSEDSPVSGYRERVPIAPSISTHSMKEYYQSDYQRQNPPAHYRHSQLDLTEWDESSQNPHHMNNNNGHSSNNVNNYHHQPHHAVGHQNRRSIGGNSERDLYQYRNGNGKGPDSRDEWEEVDRRRNENRRPDSKFNDSASVISNAVLNHFAGVHRRPVNRNSNLLSATLCLVKELDYPSLEVVEHAVRCRIDELAE